MMSRHQIRHHSQWYGVLPVTMVLDITAIVTPYKHSWGRTQEHYTVAADYLCRKISSYHHTSRSFFISVFQTTCLTSRCKVLYFCTRRRLFKQTMVFSDYYTMNRLSRQVCFSHSSVLNNSSWSILDDSLKPQTELLLQHLVYSHSTY